MTAIVWDKPGERTYQDGVDRGVLYLNDGRVAPWNGLKSIEDNTNKQTASVYLDGVKYLEFNSPGDFSAKLTALTYPEEFDEVNGVLKFIPGLHVHDQPSKSFNLAYRTKIGDDVDGLDSAYIIHLLYNVLANPDSTTHSTLELDPNPVDFSWELSVNPVKSSHNWRPTAHLSVHSNELASEVLGLFEDSIYGTDSTDPRFPTINDILTLLA